MKRTKKILSILICLSLLFTYVPIGLAAETSSLPQTSAAYAASDYAQYAAKMAVGSDHMAVVKVDGTVEAWGDNTKGQCTVPEGLTDVKAVAAGIYDTLALKTDGTVVAWGSNYAPSAGKPIIEPVSIPDEVTAVQGNIKLIAAGGATLAVVTESNQVIVWGKQQGPLGAKQPNEFGNIVAIAVNSSDVAVLDDNGNITAWGQTADTKPQELDGNTLALSAGLYHFVALKNDGKVVVWGPHAGKCNGISAVSGVRAIAGGFQFAGALLVDGSVKGWGRSPANNNVDGTELVPASANVKAISSAAEPETAYICALRGDGTLYVNGPAGPDGLNLLTETSSSNVYLSSLAVAGYDLTPVFNATITDYTVDVPSDVYSVDITAITADATANIKINGEAVASGTAQTVDNLVVGDNKVTVEVTAEDGIAVNAYTITIKRAKETEPPQGSSKATLSGLTVVGYDLDQTFDATTNTYTVNVPNNVSSVDITATTANAKATMKINETEATSGTAQNVDNLVVGNNEVTVVVTAEDGITVNTYTLIIKRASQVEPLPTPAAYAARLAGGDNHAAAVLEDGTVILWGDNSSRQLEVPVEANGVKALAAGARHTLALKEDGTVVGWGLNSYGQCDVPAVLEGIPVKDIAAYGWNSAALSKDNKIVVWGRYIENSQELENEKNLIEIAINNNYLLALAEDGTVRAWKWRESFQTCEVPVGFSGNVVSITAGDTHTLALKVDGSVVSWGNDDYPVPTELANVQAIAAGRDYSAALTADGNIRVWGKDQYGLLDVPSGLGQVQALVAGNYNVYVLKQDGTLTSWGRNWSGEGDVPWELNLFNPVSINDQLGRLIIQSVGEAGVTDCGIYPRFGCEQTEGIVDVGNGVQKVHIIAQPNSSRATLEIDGTLVTAGDPVVINDSALSVGDNSIVIKVTAESGSERSYTLHVKRVSAGYTLTPLPQTPEAYQESEYAKSARRLAAGNGHILALKNNGTVIAWGDNGQGGCNVPAGLDNVVAVETGTQHSLALKNDGTVVAWGLNRNGECNVPADLSGVAKISAGGNFSSALGKDGKVVAWGDNSQKQCDVPTDLNDVVDIQCGSNHVLALKKDGSVVAWGGNYNGQCDVPSSLDQVVAIAAGLRNSVALKDDGTLVIWGKELKNLNLQYVKGIDVGSGYIAALKWDGSLAVWSDGNDMALGVPIKLDKQVLAISGSSDNILALNGDGTLTVWGNDRYGQCDIPSWLNLFEDDPPAYSGPAPNIPQTPTAYAVSDYSQAVSKICFAGVSGRAVLNMDGTVKVTVIGDDYYNLVQVPESLNKVTAITSFANNIMALNADGTVVVWGYNGDGQCEVPENVQNVIAIAANNRASTYCLALTADGKVMAWGGNQYGQCDVPKELTNVIAIAAGDKHCLALKNDGTVVAWGNNDDGQCDVPEGLSYVARIYVDKNLSLALKNDGTVVAWGGNNDKGQCDVPEGLSGVVDIAIEGDTYAALKNNGTVVVWGNNRLGCRNVPPDLHDVAAVSIGDGVMAIKTDGTIVIWGKSSNLDDELLTSLSNVLTISKDIIIFRDGTLQYYSSFNADEINGMLAGLNVLSGHYFAINNVELLDPAGQSITSVANQAGYRIKAQVANNYGSSTAGLTIIQVRAGAGATNNGGGQVLGCVGISGDIPITGSTVSSDFTLPAGISGTAYVDVLVWEGWDTMVPRAEASQDLSFSVTN